MSVAQPAAELPRQLRYEATPSFVRVLELLGCSLAVSVYLQNRVVLVDAEAGRLRLHASPFQRPMGMALAGAGGDIRLAVATHEEAVLLRNAPLLASGMPEGGGHENLLVPRGALYTGDIDAHDLAWAGGQLFVANTRFSCIARLDIEHSFTPVWTPPFVSAIAPEDRCHLNGLTGTADRITHATALGRFDVARGWAPGRAAGGVLMEVPSGEVVLGGLSMPHSPRLFDGQLYVLESGTGRLLQMDEANHSARALAELPGFTRGMDRIGETLFIGLSRIRDGGTVPLPIHDRRDTLFCGVAAVDRTSGAVVGWMRFDDSFEEVFEVKVLPGVRNAAMLGPSQAVHRRALVIPGRAFWAGEQPIRDVSQDSGDNSRV